MSFFLNAIRQVLGSAPASRSIAKDRLSVMLVHQRNLDALESVDMEALKKEVADVIAKHIKLAKNKPTHFLGKEYSY
jgi:septum formation topological specificity factor MinE